jgi:putative oxidoreductase
VLLSMNTAITVLRVVIGFLYIGHGSQKLFGWFGGRGFEAATQMMAGMDVHPAWFWALMAGLGEFLGGLGLFLGFLTPIAAAVIVGIMLMAILKVHLENGIWNTNRGFEYPLVNLMVSAFIGLFGPGNLALDGLLNIRYPDAQVFWISLAVVVVGVLISLISGGVGEREARGA